jgi:formylglycine-generating enzyme required for sulfatase activity
VVTIDNWTPLPVLPGMAAQQPATVPVVRRWLGDKAVQEFWNSPGFVGALSESEARGLSEIFPEATFHERHMEPCHPGCFPRGTLVATPRGPQPIQELGVGDYVTTVGHNGESSSTRIESVFITSNALWRVVTPESALLTTATQPLCTTDQQPVAAGKLKAGDLLLIQEAEGIRSLPVLEAFKTNRAEQVFNLVLGEPQTFIAGGFLVRSKPPASAGHFAGATAGLQRDVAGVKLCWCPPGRFRMGSPSSEPQRRADETQVDVTLSKGFWMGKYEVTQGQWKRVIGELPGELTAELPAGDDLPVGNVNFAEAEAFCRRLTEMARQSGELPEDWEFRLPTEAQWEYACRAGTTTATSFGEQLSSKQANFRGQPYNGAEPGPSLKRAAPVGSYPANAWGLHDMHGNTFEWCRDWYHRRLPGGVDPDLRDARDTATRSEHGDISRVRRGGCWADEGWPCRSAFRLRFEPHRRYDHIGFRVVSVMP